MKREYDERKLPKWAQERLRDTRDRCGEALRELDRTRRAHGVLAGRKGWFVIPGPPEGAMTQEKKYRLFYLSSEGALPACSLREGDILLVGKWDDKGE